MNYLFKLLVIIIVSALIISCGNNHSDPFDEIGFNAFDRDLGSRIERYHQATLSNIQPERTGSSHVYIDFSNGLHQAYIGNSNNTALTQWITQALSAEPNIEWFKLANSVIEPMDFDPKTLYNKIVEPKSYSTDIMAPIEKSIYELTQRHNDGLLITDFEEFELDKFTKKGKEQFQNFAKKYFEDWLKKGNSITFFITDFTEKAKDGRMVDKHLYYIVFTYGKQSNNSMLTKIEYALKGRSFLPVRFDLSNSSYKLSTDYKSDQTGGVFYDLKASEDKKRNVLDFKKELYLQKINLGNPFEFCEFGLDWLTIEELKESYQFNYLFKGLLINLEYEDVYSIEDIEVKTYDVTSDFIQFAKGEEVLKHHPTLIKDENGDNQFALEGNNQVAISCYDKDGKLKENWKYNYKVTTPLTNLFVLNTKLFNNTRTTKKSQVELEVNFDEKFKVKNIPNPSGLMRVDLVITKVNPNLSNPKLNLFKWNSTTRKGDINEALYESIRNTIGSSAVVPKDKIIYTYYIKTL